VTGAEKLREFLGLGHDGLHDGGVLLGLALLGCGLLAFAMRLRALLRREPPLRLLQIPRMLAVLGALGGFIAYLREIDPARGPRNLFLGGLAALAWMALVVLETVRKAGSR
jgi:hypothetical protein